MQLATIKSEVWRIWFDIQSSRRTAQYQAVEDLSISERKQHPYLVSSFKEEIRQFGDLRRRQTWLKAFVCLDANGWMKDWHADPIGFVGYYADPDGVGALVKDELRAEMESYPDFLDAARRGLEMLFGEEVLGDRDCEIKTQLLEMMNKKSLLVAV